MSRERRLGQTQTFARVHKKPIYIPEVTPDYHGPLLSSSPSSLHGRTARGRFVRTKPKDKRVPRMCVHRRSQRGIAGREEDLTPQGARREVQTERSPTPSSKGIRALGLDFQCGWEEGSLPINLAKLNHAKDCPLEADSARGSAGGECVTRSS